MIYRVLGINDSRQQLTVAREDLWNSLCTRFFSDITFNYNIFRHSAGYKNVILSYDCTILIPNLPPQPNQFDCTVNSTTTTTTNINTTIATTNTTTNNATATINNATATGTIINPTTTTNFYSPTGNLSGVVGCNRSISVPVSEAVVQNLSSPAALQAALRNGFGIRWAANNSDCDGCARSGGRCGYNQTTNSFACYCSDRPYGLTCNRKSGRPDGVILRLGISFGPIWLLLSVAGVYYLVKRCSTCEGMILWNPDKENNQNIEAFIRNYGSLAPKCYSFPEIKRMTDSFAHRLGQGGYGSVYKGKLTDGRQVAVKVLGDNKGNGEEFINEVASISRTSHVNVVALLGFCYKSNRRALVYEFMSNGSLDKFICKNESQDADCRLEWKVLYQIAVGTARGLEYLHQGCNTRIVHFDIKPHNILLDEDFCPKISDFGLARLCKKKQSVLSTMGARGTVGYIAPEVVFRGLGGVSHKSDVYSYGMMVFEMVGLKSRIQVDTEKSSETYFPSWIYERLELEKDLGLEGVTNAEEEEAAMKMILVGLWCIQTKPSERPAMSKVVEMMEGSIQCLEIPPKPYLLDTPAAISSSLESSETSLL